MKDKKELAKLQSETKDYKNSLQSHQENEVNLKTIIQIQKNELVEHEETFAQIGNPAVREFEEVIRKTIDEVGKSPRSIPA